MEIAPMDIATYATNQSQAKLMNDVSVAMLSKAMDTQSTEAGGLLQLLNASDASAATSAAIMERSVNPHIGGNIDLSI